MPNVLLTRQLLGRLTAQYMVGAVAGCCDKPTLEKVFDAARQMGEGAGELLLLMDENDPRATLKEKP